MKTQKEKYLENALKYAQACKALFVDKVAKGEEYKKWSRTEKSALKKCHEIFEELRKTNRLFEIEDLMLHEEAWVRYIAATHCLFSNNVLAEKVLEDLIESNTDKIRMHALTSLKPWRNIPWTEDRYK